VAINQKLLGKITKRLGVSKSRVYAIITETAGKYNLPADIAALVVARDAGIAITRFATAEDFTLIRGVHSPSVAAIPSSSTVVVAPAHPSRPTRHPGRSQTRQPKGNKVWVVYGRDEEKRKALFVFLRSLGLQPIEWDSALAATKKGSPHIAEVLDTGFKNAVATVVLFTPDDEAKLKDKFVKKTDPSYERRQTGQPRQNVLFEAGMAFGRHPDNTILVEVGKLRPISDLVGRHAVRLTDSVATRHQLLVKLRAVGCPVDDTGDDWQTAGDFS
jgi:predicted nucleotide-binding protein